MPKFCRSCGIELTENTWWSCLRKQHTNICNKCFAQRHKKWCESNSGKAWLGKYRFSSRKRLAARKTVRKLKIEVLTHYGMYNKPLCVKCGFADIRALSIDHIDGNGGKHRATLGIQTGAQFYRWLKAQKYPFGYQTLCMNCQYIKRDENEEYRQNLKS